MWSNNSDSSVSVDGVITRSDGCVRTKSSSGSFDKTGLSSWWLPTLRPSQPTWAASLPVCLHTIYIRHHHLLLLLGPKADTHLIVPWSVEG